jgi:cysteinyl-tRNA synthetase
MKVYNSLTKKLEEFIPLEKGRVRMYSCGPTIYDRKQIGNLRTYTFEDLLLRVLRYLGNDVTYIMNFTDVGHLTGDNEGDADSGEDRLAKAARKERRTAWDIAKSYEAMFIEDIDMLNLVHPDKFVRATDHIHEQIDLIKKLEEKGFTYTIDDGVYFDTQKYDATSGFKYGELSNLDQLKEGTRIEPNVQKKNPRDFGLWKFSPSPPAGGAKRDMEWDSPWGKGFPGWHIECSAMAMKYLGEQFDIHCGGEDIKSTHHPNEIAQAQAATGKQYVRYWLHGAMLMVDGERMATSKSNNFKMPDILEKGFEPLSLRYLYLTAHYKTQLNFTWSALAGAQAAYLRLKEFVANARTTKAESRVSLSDTKLKKIDEFRTRFLQYISDDLNFPSVVALIWEIVKSNIPDYDKADLIVEFDQVLGLNLTSMIAPKQAPELVKQLAQQRLDLRSQGKYDLADEVRKQIESHGWQVKDNAGGFELLPIRL